MGKKIRICLEVQGLGEDGYGAPCPDVVCVTLGDEDAEELTGAEYEKFLQQIKIEDVLRLTFLDYYYSPSDCRLITPDEYDRQCEE